MESLFDKVGFIKEYRAEFTEFYKPYFNSEKELNDFFIQVFKNDALDKTPRRMLNQIQRFVSLTNDIEIIRPDRDALRIVFLRTCIESLCRLGNKNDEEKERKDKKFFFSRYFTEEDKQYILDNFVFKGLEPYYYMDEKSKLLFDNKANYSLTIDDFGMILFKVRGMVVHEGDYWSMQFFSRDNEYTWCVSMETDETLIGDYIPEKGKPVSYCFETTLNYECFINCFVKGCISYVQHYIDNNFRGGKEYNGY